MSKGHYDALKMLERCTMVTCLLGILTLNCFISVLNLKHGIAFMTILAHGLLSVLHFGNVIVTQDMFNPSRHRWFYFSYFDVRM